MPVSELHAHYVCVIIFEHMYVVTINYLHFISVHFMLTGKLISGDCALFCRFHVH